MKMCKKDLQCLPFYLPNTLNSKSQKKRKKIEIVCRVWNWTIDSNEMLVYYPIAVHTVRLFGIINGFKYFLQVVL